MPAGRPSKFRQEFCEQARKFCLLGATNENLATFFDVTETTLYKWMAEKPEFSKAIKEGREYADANVGARLYERAMGYSHKAVKHFHYQGKVIKTNYVEHYPPDPISMIFWLKNRRPDLWRDKPTPNDSDDTPPVTVIIQNSQSEPIADKIPDDTE